MVAHKKTAGGAERFTTADSAEIGVLAPRKCTSIFCSDSAAASACSGKVCSSSPVQASSTGRVFIGLLSGS